MNSLLRLPLGQFIFNLIGVLVICSHYWLMNVEKSVDMPVDEDDTSYTQVLMYVVLGLVSCIGGGSLYLNGYMVGACDC